MCAWPPPCSRPSPNPSARAPPTPSPTSTRCGRAHRRSGPRTCSIDMNMPGRPTIHRVGVLLAILAVSGGVRFWDLGRLSFWYDEVVTMRLARTEGPLPLLRLLEEIDATRAPLHPLLLQPWLALFGPSEASGRALSAACGVITIALVYRLGREFFGDCATAT